MLPFASALAIAALGQTLVVMQGGIDLSVAGGLSLYVVIVTKYPAGDNARLLPAIGIAFLAAIAAGSLNGFLIGRMRLNPIVATLGTNALLYGAVLWYTAGIPTTTTARLARARRRALARDPGSGVLRRRRHGAVTAVVKLTPAGRRFEGVGANGVAALTAGIRVQRHRTAAYVWAQILYCLAAVLHAGIVNQPTAYEGDNYLLPSVAAVVLGGTSLLGGRGNLVATAVAALFLSQLDQFVLALGVTYATRTARPGGGARRRRRPLHRSTGRRLARRLPGRRPGERRAHLTTAFRRERERSPTDKKGRTRTMTKRRGGVLLALALIMRRRSCSPRRHRRPRRRRPCRRGAARRRSRSA